jgi:acetyl-CoA acetyltransferase
VNRRCATARKELPLNTAPSVAIAGSFELKPARYPEYSPHNLYRHVAISALRQWGLKPSDVNGLLAMPSGQGVGAIDIYTHEKLGAELGLQPAFAETLNAGGASYAIMVGRAASAIRDGLADSVLCIGTGKFTKPTSGGAEVMARMISEPDFEIGYGTFIPALYALIASRFMAERGVTAADIARVAVSARQWALRNPRALMHERGPISIDDVLNSRMIAEPFHYLDCSVPCDGGGAVLVTSAEKARHLTRQPAYLLGYGESHSHGSLSSAEDRLIETVAVRTGADAFKRAGLSHQDIDLAMLYDAFSVTPLILLENLGFCKPGQAARFVQSGAIDPGGSLPVNTNGGLMSFGHTGESSGMSLIVEAARQVMGEAGDNQVDNVRTALVHCYGGMMYEHATLILGRSQ